jgi:hypothetical protein
MASNRAPAFFLGKKPITTLKPPDFWSRKSFLAHRKRVSEVGGWNMRWNDLMTEVTP